MDKDDSKKSLMDSWGFFILIKYLYITHKLKYYLFFGFYGYNTIMIKRKRPELLSYINTPMSRESITILYSANNVRHEKCELYSDFIQSLIHLIFDTYMGDDITNISEQKNHFKWCWDKNIKNFVSEGVTIISPKLYKYFSDFMFEVYYSTTKEETGKANKNILTLWLYIFDYNNNKSKSDIDTLLEVYKLFENALQSE